MNTTGRGKHLLVGVILGMLIQVQAQEQTLNRIRITSSAPEALANQLDAEGYGVLKFDGNGVDLAVGLREWEVLLSQGYSPVFVEKGRPFNEIQQQRAAQGTVPTGYSDLDAIIAQMQAVEDNFPAIVELVNLTQKYGTPQTFEGRDLYALKISDNVGDDEDEPSLLIVSAHHCREIVTPVLALYAIEQLTSMYGVDPAITDAVNDYEIWVSPVWNPDGYNHVFTGDNFWRKNRRVFADGIGVDLNRNYDFAWDSACGGSSFTGSETFRGPSAASEPETQTMMAFSEDRHFTKVIDYHSSGREALYAYDSFCNLHPFSNYLQQNAVALSTASGYFGDHRIPSANGEHYEWQLKAFSSFAFLIETHTSFQPSFASAEAEAQTVWPGLLWTLDQSIPLSGHVRSLTTGEPLSATLDPGPGSSTNGEVYRTRPLNGRYHLFVPPGQYDVTFSAEGYEPQTHTVNITGDDLMLDVDLAPEGVCRGDLTGNEMIAVPDLVQVVSALGQSSGPEDINGDGTVDQADILLMASAWGGCIPESLQLRSVTKP